MTEDEMLGWHHQLNGYESGQTPGDSEGQGSLACCSSQGHIVRHNFITKQQQQMKIHLIQINKDFPSVSDSKNSACNEGDPGSIPGSEDPLEKEMATHSSILAWRIPQTEEPDGLQSMEPQRKRNIRSKRNTEK